MRSVRHSDGWRNCVPGLCFMKVKGPQGWSVKHIISVNGWTGLMDQGLIIKHLEKRVQSC